MIERKLINYGYLNKLNFFGSNVNFFLLILSFLFHFPFFPLFELMNVLDFSKLFGLLFQL